MENEKKIGKGLEYWDRWYLGLAQYISTASKDPSTKVGCVVVGATHREIRATGYNGFARRVSDTEERLNKRALKYELTVHAETNAILNASLVGASLEGSVSYCTWPPCTRCACNLIQAGIEEIVYPQVEIPERWIEDFELARGILQEAGVEIRSVKL